jgi:hypothetical protein
VYSNVQSALSNYGSQFKSDEDYASVNVSYNYNGLKGFMDYLSIPGDDSVYGVSSLGSWNVVSQPKIPNEPERAKQIEVATEPQPPAKPVPAPKESLPKILGITKDKLAALAPQLAASAPPQNVRPRPIVSGAALSRPSFSTIFDDFAQKVDRIRNSSIVASGTGFNTNFL